MPIQQAATGAQREPGARRSVTSVPGAAAGVEEMAAEATRLLRRWSDLA